jgi:hypothetical protein
VNSPYPILRKLLVPVAGSDAECNGPPKAHSRRLPRPASREGGGLLRGLPSHCPSCQAQDDLTSFLSSSIVVSCTDHRPPTIPVRNSSGRATRHAWHRGPYEQIECRLNQGECRPTGPQ